VICIQFLANDSFQSPVIFNQFIADKSLYSPVICIQHIADDSLQAMGAVAAGIHACRGAEAIKYCP
jgi:hypothetical protein